MFELALAKSTEEVHVPSLFHLGHMQHKSGLLKDALKSFTDVLTQRGNDRLTYQSRGLVYQDMKQHELAIADFQNALQLEPNYAEVYY